MAEGVELIGEQAGSGYRKPPSLARRGDGQMIQLTPLLYQVACLADGERDYEAIAREMTEAIGRGVSADNVRTLVEDKLRPLGILAQADGSSPPMEKPDPLLALRFRRAVIPEHLSLRVASLFKPLFWPPVVVVALAALVAFDVWLFVDHGVAQSFRQALYEPAVLLAVLALVVISAGWHEFGHAAGCAYGGACPGAMGAGIYLVYPAFYTDVTDSYRLGRGGKLRTDLAGVYFNGLFVLAMAGVYALTGWEAILLVILVQHIEVAHQLLPFLRLDGYYVVADLTGVPDLFARIKPILASAVPGRKADPRVDELKPWVRLVVTTWVLAVIPLLAFQLGLILLHAPRIFATAWDSLGQQRDAVTKAMADGDLLAGLAGVLQALILVIPLAGLVLTGLRLARRGARWGVRTTSGRPVVRLAAGAVAVALVGLLAYTWIPDGDYRPIGPRERGTLREGLVAVARVPGGRPSLVVSEEAGEPVPPTEDPAASSTSTSLDATTTSAARKRVPSVSTTLARRSTSTTDDATTTTARRTSTTTAGGGVP